MGSAISRCYHHLLYIWPHSWVAGELQSIGKETVIIASQGCAEQSNNTGTDSYRCANQPVLYCPQDNSCRYRQTQSPPVQTCLLWTPRGSSRTLLTRCRYPGFGSHGGHCGTVKGPHFPSLLPPFSISPSSSQSHLPFLSSPHLILLLFLSLYPYSSSFFLLVFLFLYSPFPSLLLFLSLLPLSRPLLLNNCTFRSSND